jgi:N-acetyl-gamma-glutamyl-phosphate reductase
MGSSPDIRVALVGANGYVGQVLHALLLHHPCMKPVIVDARDPSGAAASIARECGAAMLAVPDDAAIAWASELGAASVRTVDLSTAHRTAADVFYGLPELWGAPPEGVRLVSNPGCYPTATLLALAPLVRAGLVHDRGLAIVGCSGTSGAGKAVRDDLHFSELHGNLFPYKVGEHKHIAEIQHKLGGISASFVTQLVPIVRGLLVTAFVPTDADPATLRSTLAASYEGHPWITVLAEPGQGLGVRHVVGTHQAVIAVGPRADGGVVPVFAAIDNLLRGAASQAVHTLNLWLGLPAGSGLPEPLRTPPSGVPGMTRMLP